MAVQRLTIRQHEFLSGIGLSRDTIAVYDELLSAPKLTAAQAALALQSKPSAIYRLFYALERLGLAQNIGGRPRAYCAVAPNIGLVAAERLHQDSLHKLLGTVQTPAAAQAQLLIGRQALYDHYEYLANHSSATIQDFSIGIAYSQTLYNTQQNAIRRGVYIKHIVQELRPSNYNVLIKWQRLGVNLRHFPAERGLHFMIFDSKTVLISFSDPANTDNRISIATDAPAAVAVFAGQFNELWRTSQPVNI